MSWVIKKPETGQYLRRIGSRHILACERQIHAFRFESRDLALDLAFGLGAIAVKLVPKVRHENSDDKT